MNKYNEIMKRLKEHYDEALSLVPESQIVGVFLRGSQNYGLDVDSSDVDSMCIVIPSYEHICFATKPVSTTHIRKNNEHIDLKDIRLISQTFRKQNINFIEILFTEYKFINPMYEDEWNQLIKQNELIANYNPHKAVSTMKGIASEKYHALEHRYPSREEVINKFGGYDPKQLHHLIRVHDFLSRYIQGIPYSKCLKPEPEKAEYLKKIKENGVEGGLEEARRLAEKYFDEIREISDEFRKNCENKGNHEVDKLLDDIQKEIMKKYLKLELKNDFISLL